MNVFKTKEAKNAFYIGGMCSVAYLITYLGRNILSAISPQMIEQGILQTEFIGNLSSLFFICYAIGQLLNGIIGDKIRANYMIGFGLILAGCCGIGFSFLVGYPKSISVLYGMMGFFLSMVFAPMVKITAENTTTAYAVYCNVGYDIGALLGTPIAGVLAVFLNWKNVLRSGSGAMIFMGILCLLGFSIMRHRGIVKYNRYREVMNKEWGQRGGVRALIEHDIIRFIPVAMLTGIVRTTVVFWIPTYLTQHLEFSPETASGIYTVVTLLISTSVFLAVFLYVKLGNNMYLTIFIGFAVSTAAFLGAYFVGQRWLNIGFLVLAIVFEQVVSSMLWTRYCPGLCDTGMTSSATGFLDFCSYIAAAISSSLFANSVEKIGWGNLILIWAGLMLIGALIILSRKR